jgi:SPP1 gp7 family putative phage head morphogenesis protein
MKDIELKSLIDDLINRFMKLLNLSPISLSVSKVITENYLKGLERAELELNMNFIKDEERLNLLKNYTFDNIKGMNDEIAEKLRKELSQGLMNLESVTKLKERVKKVMNVSEERARLIATTEAHRAEVTGSMDAARQSGLKLMKQWDAHLDKRVCKFCEALDGQTIPLDKKFNHNGVYLDSPADNHPRCRCVVKFIQK